MKRKVTGIILLCCLVAPLVASFSILHIRKTLTRREVKKELLAGTDKKDLFMLSLPIEAARKELRWEHEKEFEYMGCMYDVLEQQIAGDTIHLLCWQDEKETDLNRELKELAAKALDNDPIQKNRQKRISDFLQQFYLNENSRPFWAGSQTGRAQFICITVRYADPDPTPPVPPPRLA